MIKLPCGHNILPPCLLVGADHDSQDLTTSTKRLFPLNMRKACEGIQTDRAQCCSDSPGLAQARCFSLGCTLVRYLPTHPGTVPWEVPNSEAPVVAFMDSMMVTPQHSYAPEGVHAFPLTNGWQLEQTRGPFWCSGLVWVQSCLRCRNRPGGSNHQRGHTRFMKQINERFALQRTFIEQFDTCSIT